MYLQLICSIRKWTHFRELNSAVSQGASGNIAVAYKNVFFLFIRRDEEIKQLLVRGNTFTFFQWPCSFAARHCMNLLLRMQSHDTRF